MNISITLILYKSEKCITRQKVFNNEENQFFNTLRAKWKEQNTKEKNPEIKWHFLLPKKTNPPNPNSKTTVKSKKTTKMVVFRKDPCGVTCLLMTYAAVIYADYVVVRWIVLQSMPETYWGLFHIIAFNGVVHQIILPISNFRIYKFINK